MKKLIVTSGGFLFIASVFIFIYLFLFVGDDGSIVWGQLLLLVSGIYFVVSAVVNKYGSPGVFSPYVIISAVYFVIYGLGSVNYLFKDIGLLVKPLWLVLASYVFISLGVAVSMLGFNVNAAVKRRLYYCHIKGYSRKSVNVVVLVILFLALIAAVVMYLKVGLPFMYDDKVTGRLDARKEVTSWVVYLMYNSMLAFFIYIGFKVAEFGGVKKKEVPFIVMFWLLVAFLNIMPGWRGQLIFFTIGTVAVLHFTYKFYEFKQIAVVGLVAIMLATGWGLLRVFSGGEERTYVTYLAQFVDSDYQLFLLLATLSISVYMLGLVEVARVVPDYYGFEYGGVYLKTIATALPGEGKTIGKYIKEAANLNFEGPGINVTLVGESYIDFGIAGVVLYSLIYGICLGWLYKRAFMSTKWAILYSYVIVVFIVGVMTGVLAQAIYTFQLIVVVIALLAIHRRVVVRK